MEEQDFTEEYFKEWGERWLEDVLIVDEEGRENEFYNSQQNLIDELGVEGFSKDFQQWIFDNAVDSDWFEEWKEDYFYTYIEDIKEEEGRLEEEMKEAGVDNEEDFLEYLKNTIDDVVEYFIDNFGENYFKNVVEDNNLIDWDTVIEEIAEWDGYGSLAYYDGIEHEYCINNELYFLYRQN